MFHLDGLYPEDAEKLLVHRSQDSQAKSEDVKRLTASLFYSPLAINQAASHIAKYNLTINDYLEMYDRSGEDRSKMFGQSDGLVSEELSAMKAWWFSFEKLKENDALAIYFLQLMAMYSSRDIPERLLPRECEEVDFLKATRALEALSFIDQHRHSKLYNMDPLIQMAVRSHLRSTDQFERYYLLAIEVALKLFPETYDSANDLETASLLVSHVQELLHQNECKALSPTRMEMGALASRVSLFLREQGHNATAVHYARLAVNFMTNNLGTNDSRTLKALSDLSICLRTAGALEEAESKANDALGKRTSTMGPTHSDTLASMNNLANVLYCRGKFREAEDLYRRTVAMKEETLGADHADTLKTLDNLSVTLQKLGKLEEAESHCQRVLEKREQQLGSEDPSTLTSKSNLGTILQLQKRWEESWELHTAALMGRVKILGRNHPETINSYANLAAILQCQQQFESAQVMAQVVLDMRTSLLREDHPDTIKAIRNMASLLHSMQKWREAERMSTQAFRLARSALGEEHPDTLAAKSHADGLRDWLRRHPEHDSAKSNSSSSDVD
jgi:tetratricopeptide (TPR) repeat protein